MKSQPRADFQAFGQALREAIKAKKLSQAKIAAMLGLEQTTVSAYCCGRNAPNDERVRALEDLLELKSGTLGKLLPEDRRQRPGKKAAPVRKGSKLEPEHGQKAIQPATKKNTAADADPPAEQPAQKKIAQEKAAVVREVTFSESTDGRRMPERKKPPQSALRAASSPRGGAPSGCARPLASPPLGEVAERSEVGGGLSIRRRQPTPQLHSQLSTLNALSSSTLLQTQ